ncbi:tRNA glutamyl-Q(34) synthetase GluQRS [Leptogranulimonas caecicola]
MDELADVTQGAADCAPAGSAGSGACGRFAGAVEGLPDLTASPQHTEVCGRFAPTPSGRMHLGNVFSCLLAWLDARRAGGSIVLRMEDLDPATCDKQKALQLMDDLRWLGLTWDGDPWYQSERSWAYGEALEALKAQGLVYPCFCSRAELHAANAPHASDGTYIYAGTCRGLSAAEVAERSLVKRPALRVMVPKLSDPAGSIEFIDGVYGLQSTVLARDCGDFVVRRSDGVYAYQLAVVVDDAAMGVNHVVRAHDLMGSSGRQRYLQHVLGLGEVEYFHVPLLVAPDGRRLAKRDFDLDLGSLRTWMRGPERLLGLLAWKVGFIERFEPMSAAELVGEFSWDKVAARRDDIVVDEALVDALRG